MKIIIEFIYNGKTYFTSKLDKKLNKLKISKDDITIVREFEEIENNKTIKQNNQEIDTSIKKYYFWDRNTNYTYITLIPDKSYFYNNMYNETTKTGIKEWTNEFINNLILLNSIPKYPIELINDYPVLL